MSAEAGSDGDGDSDAAIRALGPLFRITEVFLRDYTSSSISKSSIRHDSSPREGSADYMNSAVSCSNVDSVVDDTTPEDLELARQMDALGLPTSFKTNKERRNTCTREERKGVTKSTSVHKVTGVQDIQVPEISTLAEVIDGVSSQISSFSSTTSHTCAAGQAENVASRFDTDDTFNKVGRPDSEPNNQDAIILGRIVKEQACSEVMDAVKADSMMDYPSIVTTEKNTEDDIKSIHFKPSSLEENEVKNIDHLCFQGGKLRYGQGRGINLDNTSSLCLATKSEKTCFDSNPVECSSCSSGFENGTEWGVYWDAFYMRNYYYNFHTQESSWYPPPGLDQAGLLATWPTSSGINTDVTEDGAYLAFVWDYNDHEHSARAPNPITEGQNDGELSVQASDEFTSRVDLARENLISDVHSTLLGGSSNNFDGYVEHTNSSKTSNFANNFGEAPCSPSDMLNQVDRLTVSCDMGAEEKWLCVSQEDDVTSMFKDLHGRHLVVNGKKKRKVKRIISNQKMLSAEDKGHGLPETIERLPTFVIKYWYQRYSLFSKFDHGMKVDEEGWFSVTPEAIARHHASRCGHGVVIDCFTGIGGNAIQFAMRSNHVIAIDIDPQKVDFARHNATIYGVKNNIDFINGDFFILASQLKADTLFMSPPWGGPDYAKVEVYDIKSMLQPHDGYFLFKTAMKIASTVVMFLPRNVDTNQLAELSLLASSPWELEVEKNYLNGRLKGITAYFSQPSNIRQEHTR